MDDEFNPEDLATLNDPNEESLQLIEFDDKTINLNKKALDIIRSIDDEIIIVSAVGKYKTGKSFLLNLLLDQNNQGVKIRNITLYYKNFISFSFFV